MFHIVAAPLTLLHYILLPVFHVIDLLCTRLIINVKLLVFKPSKIFFPLAIIFLLCFLAMTYL